MIELSDEQRKIVESPEKKIVVVSSAGSGKAQPDYTRVPTPDGVKRLDELKVGDCVFDRYGKPTKILEIFLHKDQEIYEIELADGRITECCKEHLWSYNRNGRGGLSTISTLQMFELGWKTKDNRGHNSYNFRIPTLIHPVEFTKKQYSIHPYVIGSFIGDGCCLEHALTMSSQDEDSIKYIAKLNNFTYKKNHPNNYSWNFYKEDKKIRTKDFFKKYKKELLQYCGDKSIPEEYLIGDIEQRLQLMQGLMDTDGTTGNGRHSPSFSTTSKKLAEQVLWLGRSLGFLTTLRIQDRRPKRKSIEYDVGIFTSNQRAHEIFYLPRKKEKALSFIDKKMRRKNEFISIIDIRKTNKKVPMRCITVDNAEQLYLTNDFIVTHNTRIILERTRWILRQGGDPEKMVVITFTVNAADELKMRLGADYKDGLFIGTVHGYANMLLNRWGVSTTDAINSEDFDHFFTLIKQNPDAIKEIGFLALDEAQDSNFKQFDFIFKMLNPKNFIAVGDFRQSIYGFAGCDPNLLINLGRKPDVTTYDLQYNYRSKSEIVKYSNWIVSLMEEVPNIQTLSVQPGYGLVETIYGDQYIDLILDEGYYKDWAILCRTNNRVYNIIRNLKDYDIPAITFRQAQNSLVDLEEKMNSNSVKVLTMHSSKGLQFPKVIVADQMWKTEEDKRLMYVAATRAENELYWLKRERRYY